jgi:hypothetical protein
MGKNPEYSQKSDERDCIRAALEQRVMLALWDLGATHDEIALALKANGIVGRRQSPSECPVAHYLRRKLGLRGLQVLGDAVTELLKNSDALVVLPRAVREFVARFDQGAYGELAVPSQRKRRAGVKANIK